ncbi:MAG: MBL fold metallo-hydrolase [Janthinobacterium lividum]
MNLLEQKLDYVFQDTLPAAGRTFDVAPGIRWVRMPLPFALDHINLWLLRDTIDGRDGWTAIDTGVATADIKTRWEQIFETELDGLPIVRVLATHFHPDHIGLSHWLTEGGDQRRWQVRLWASLGEYLSSKNLVNASGPREAADEALIAHLQRNGLNDPETLSYLRSRDSHYRKLVPALPSSYRRIREGDSVRIGNDDWRVIAGFGHSPEHSALFCADRGILISGDMVLPRISTNVSVYEQEPEGNGLHDYLQSLGRYDDLPAQTLVLPSHGKPFRGLHERLKQLREHHADRLDEVREACHTAPCSAADIVPVMFPRALDAHQMTFALGEALAHLHLLWHAGELTRSAGDDGVYRFAPR